MKRLLLSSAVVGALIVPAAAQEKFQIGYVLPESAFAIQEGQAMGWGQGVELVKFGGPTGFPVTAQKLQDGEIDASINIDSVFECGFDKANPKPCIVKAAFNSRSYTAIFARTDALKKNGGKLNGLRIAGPTACEGYPSTLFVMFASLASTMVDGKPQAPPMFCGDLAAVAAHPDAVVFLTGMAPPTRLQKLCDDNGGLDVASVTITQLPGAFNSPDCAGKLTVLRDVGDGPDMSASGIVVLAERQNEQVVVDGILSAVDCQTKFVAWANKPENHDALLALIQKDLLQKDDPVGAELVAQRLLKVWTKDGKVPDEAMQNWQSLVFAKPTLAGMADVGAYWAGKKGQTFWDFSLIK